MQLIDIFELKNYSKEEVKDYLLGFEDSEFVITFPRYFHSGYDDSATACEFCTMAYAGQLINDVSVKFGYYVPWPQANYEFFFEIEIKDFDGLSAVLAGLAARLFTDSTLQQSFEDEAYQYLSDCFDGKRESDCWGLLDVSNEHNL